MSDGYIAPDPTPEQIANCKAQGLDPYDRGGSLPYWDFAADDTLAAAATIHDEEYMRGGDQIQRNLIDDNFARDCMILARAVEDPYKRLFEIAKAEVCAEVVNLAGSTFWTANDRNTPITEKQGAVFIAEAQCWINECAAKIGEPAPYPEVK